MSRIIFCLFVILFCTVNCDDKSTVLKDMRRDRTCTIAKETKLRWDIDSQAADEICCNNKGLAEP